jgi:Ni/Co efflux regulator RcnB
MKCLAMLVAISVIAASAAPVKSRAQSPATSPTAPVTGMKPDRTTADPATRKAMREKETALRQKRADCRKQARQQKVPLLKRRAFVKDYTSRSLNRLRRDRLSQIAVRSRHDRSGELGLRMHCSILSSSS